MSFYRYDLNMRGLCAACESPLIERRQVPNGNFVCKDAEACWDRNADARAALA